MPRCIYPGCSTAKTKSTLQRKSFHSIPSLKNVDLRRRWLAALQMDLNSSDVQTQGRIICSDHFNADDFRPKQQEEETTGSLNKKKGHGLRRLKIKTQIKIERTRLQANAVPQTAKPKELSGTPLFSTSTVTEEEFGELSTPMLGEMSLGAEVGDSSNVVAYFGGPKFSTPTKFVPTERGSQTAIPFSSFDLMTEWDGHTQEGAQGQDAAGTSYSTPRQCLPRPKDNTSPSCHQKQHASFYLTSPPQQKQSTRASLSGEYMARPATCLKKEWAATSTNTLDSTAFGRLEQTDMDADISADVADLSTSFGEVDIWDTSDPAANESVPSVDVGMRQNKRDPDFLPSNSPSPDDSTSSEDDNDEDEDWDHERRWIVNESHLHQLFKFCIYCGNPIEKSCTVPKSSQLKVKWQCLGDCIKPSWTSGPQYHNRTAENDIFISAGIFYTGATYMDIFEWAQMISLQIPQQTHYYNIQSDYLIPVIHAAYKDHNSKIIERLIKRSADGQRIELCGDGRSDSPGFSAKYTTYSFQDDVTKEVVHFELVQVNEASSSVAMEVMGFERGLEQLLHLGVDVSLITTDRSPSIRKLMDTKYKGVIEHQFDAWHVGKSVKKKLMAAAIKAPNRMLQRWIKAINNHLYWSCESSGGDPEAVVSQWKSLLHHICGTHRWEEDGHEQRCKHREYTAEEQAKKIWLKPDTPPFNALKSIVMDPNILRDLQKMAHFKHTGSLEVFHSSMLKYTPKRIHFFYESMSARTKLAVLDHNLNVGRQQATTKTGQQMYKYVEPKVTKRWAAKTAFQKTQQLPFRRKLMDRLLIKVHQEPLSITKKKKKAMGKRLPRPNIAKTPMPEKSELQANSSERFKHHSTLPDQDWSD